MSRIGSALSNPGHVDVLVRLVRLPRHWPASIDVVAEPMLGVATTLSAGAGTGTHQSSGRSAKSRLAFLYHPIPERGCFHLPFISFKALSCVASPFATASFRCLSCAFMTSSAVFPWCGKSHGPPSCLHVIVFIKSHSLSCVLPSTETVESDEATDTSPDNAATASTANLYGPRTGSLLLKRSASSFLVVHRSHLRLAACHRNRPAGPPGT